MSLFKHPFRDINESCLSQNHRLPAEDLGRHVRQRRLRVRNRRGGPGDGERRPGRMLQSPRLGAARPRRLGGRRRRYQGRRQAGPQQPVSGGPEEAEPHTEVRPLPQPRRGVLPEGTQALLPLEGLPVRQLPAGGGETAGDGGAGGPEEAASHGGKAAVVCVCVAFKCFSETLMKRKLHSSTFILKTN